MWTLPISRAVLESIYNDKVDLSIFSREPADNEDLAANFLTSKLWRLNNLYTIIDKDGIRIPFHMNYAQHIVYAAVLGHARIIILKSRQQGISTFWLISYLDDSLVLPDITIGLMAQGLSEASTLLKRVKLAWNTFSPEIIQFLALKLTTDNASELVWSNGSTLFIRTSFRSATLQRLHISELGKIANKNPERAKETMTGTMQAIRPGNPVVIESTAEGDNVFKILWTQARLTEARIARGDRSSYAGKDFMPVFLSWLDDPDCNSDDLEVPSATEAQYFAKLEQELGVVVTQAQKNFWVAQYRELGDSIYQEYPATDEEAFRKVLDGSYYGAAYMSLIARRGRVKDNLYDVNLPVSVAMDLGSDNFALVYFQRFQDEWRIIDEYENSGEGLAFYVDQMRSTGYDIQNVIVPHDIAVVELGTGKSRLARLRELGVRGIQELPRTSIESGIERVRKIISSLWIDSKCRGVIAAFQNYSKEWDDKHGVWKAKAMLSKYNHLADAIRYMSVSNVTYKKQSYGAGKRQDGFEV